MIGFLVFGLVVGIIARVVLLNRHPVSLPATVGAGIVGSLAGGLVATALGSGDLLELDWIGSIVAIASAAALIVLIDRVGRTDRA